MNQAVQSRRVTLDEFEALAKTVIGLQSTIADLTAKVEALSAAPAGRNRDAQREMTDDDARRIMSGDLKDEKHNDAAAKLNLSYGQVYSARLGYTFKHIHKEMKDSATKNPWMKD